MARKLFWGSGSAWCWRIQLVLEEKGLDYESILISFSKKEHKGPEIVALNPRGQVPTFVDGDVVVNESAAACLYLDAAYPTSGPRLIPDDIQLKARVLQLMFESSNLYTTSIDLFRYFGTASKAGSLNAEEWAEKKAPLKREFGIWEGYLKGKKFLVADSLTMADLFVYPFLVTAVRYGIDFEKAGYPAIGAYVAHMTPRDSVQKSWPPHWKEGPGNGALADF